MMKLIVGTSNLAKLEAVRLGASDALAVDPESIEVIGSSVSSGVSDQPLSYEEILTGSTQRAKATMLSNPDAGYGFGLEGGLVKGEDDAWYDLGIVVVRDQFGNSATCESERVLIPKELAKIVVENGVELSVAMQQMFGLNTINTRDCTGFLTDGRLPVVEFYRTAVKSALESIAPTGDAVV